MSLLFKLKKVALQLSLKNKAVVFFGTFSLFVIFFFQNCGNSFNLLPSLSTNSSRTFSSVSYAAESLSTAQVINSRRSDSAVLSRGSYDYAPSVMKDGKYRLWWCAGVAGDHILYSEADSPQGPWSDPVDVFGPPGIAGTFDSVHTCDPSVIRVGTTYYMYYGGAGDSQPTYTKIGVAQSEDGRNWTRMNGGNPILTPSMQLPNITNAYGAGQPSAVYLNGYFYIIYTDTTGAASNPLNGAGQYVVRSTSPSFESYEVLTAGGFVTATAQNSTEYSVFDAYSVDMLYSDMIDKMIIAIHGSQDQTTMRTLDPATFQQTHADIGISGPTWRDGAGLARRPDGHGIPSITQGLIPIDILSAGGSDLDPTTWDLFWSGADLQYEISQVDWSRVFDGYLFSSPGFPLTLVTGGKRLQFANGSVGNLFSRNYIEVPSWLFYEVPYGASLYNGNNNGQQVLGARARPGAYLLDDGKLWPVSCIEAVSLNGASLNYVSTSEFDSYSVVSSLFCVNK